MYRACRDVEARQEIERERSGEEFGDGDDELRGGLRRIHGWGQCRIRWDEEYADDGDTRLTFALDERLLHEISCCSQSTEVFEFWIVRCE